jgi:hypothetical protein
MEESTSRRFNMPAPTSSASPEPTESFFNRVAQNDATKRGAAAAVAGILTAVITEAWKVRG